MAVPELESYRWKQRPLLVFSPSAGDSRRAVQIQRVEAERAAFDERGMVLLEIVAGGDDSADGAGLRARFHVDEAAFAAVLIGKDGTAKGRWTEPVEMRELWEVIDAMPMRQREMEQRGSAP